MQSCCFANLNLLLFCRCRCRHRRHCLSSLMCKKERDERWRHSPRVSPSRAPFFLVSIKFKPLLRRLPNMPMHNLQNSASFIVCYTAVFSVVTQRSSSQSKWRRALRGDSKNGCVADYFIYGHGRKRSTALPLYKTSRLSSITR